MSVWSPPSQPPWPGSAFIHGLRTERAERTVTETRFAELRSLAVTAERGLDSAQGHPERVGATALAIARRLGLDPFAAVCLGQAAPLHDIGKLAVPDTILRTPGPLTAAQFEIVKRHTTAGAQMLSGSGSRLLGLAREVALTHHERFDGGGYPYGLAGAEIPLSGRIVALADVFDALTHARPYKDAWPIAEAVREVRRLRGAQFDPAVLDAFLSVIGEVTLARPELADAA